MNFSVAKLVGGVKKVVAVFACVAVGFAVGVVVQGAGLLNLAGVMSLGSRTEINSAAIAASFKDASELTTQEYAFTTVGMVKDAKQVKMLAQAVDLPFTEKTLLVTYDGKVRAGLKAVDHVDPDVNDFTKTVKVKAPAVELLGTEIASAKVWDEEDGVFNEVTSKDVVALESKIKKDMEEAALSNGVLDKAEAQASALLAKQVTSLLESSGREGYKVTVEFAEPKAEATPGA